MDSAEIHPGHVARKQTCWNWLCRFDGVFMPIKGDKRDLWQAAAHEGQVPGTFVRATVGQKSRIRRSVPKAVYAPLPAHPNVKDVRLHPGFACNHPKRERCTSGPQIFRQNRASARPEWPSLCAAQGMADLKSPKTSSATDLSPSVRGTPVKGRVRGQGFPLTAGPLRAMR